MPACAGEQPMVRETIAFVNQKGGVGKTTTAVSLAAALGRRGDRVLLIDLDAQANATSSSGAAGFDGPSVYELLMLEAEARDCVVRVEEEKFDLIPATRELSGAEVELAPALAREQRLKTVLEPLLGDYDWVFIDSPPSLGILTVNALTAATSVVIPVQCEYLPMEGVARLMETLGARAEQPQPAAANPRPGADDARPAHAPGARSRRRRDDALPPADLHDRDSARRQHR